MSWVETIVLVFRRDNGDILDGHGSGVPLQGLHDLFIFRGFIQLLMDLLQDLFDRDKLSFLHQPADQEDLLFRKPERVPLGIEDVVGRVSSLSGIELGAERFCRKDPGAPGSGSDRSHRHPGAHEGCLESSAGARSEGLWRPVESLFGEAVRVLFEEDPDIVKTVSKVPPFLNVAEEKGIGIAGGHPACRGEERPGPDVIAIEDLVAGSLQVAAIELMGR